jgi:hypothetical protein
MNAPEQLLLLEPSPAEAAALAQTHWKRAALSRAASEAWFALGLVRLASESAAAAAQSQEEGDALAVYAEVFGGVA